MMLLRSFSSEHWTCRDVYVCSTPLAPHTYTQFHLMFARRQQRACGGWRWGVAAESVEGKKNVHVNQLERRPSTAVWHGCFSPHHLCAIYVCEYFQHLVKAVLSPLTLPLCPSISPLSLSSFQQYYYFFFLSRCALHVWLAWPVLCSHKYTWIVVAVTRCAW